MCERIPTTYHAEGTMDLNWFNLPLQIGLGIAVAHIFTRILGLIGV